MQCIQIFQTVFKMNFSIRRFGFWIVPLIVLTIQVRSQSVSNKAWFPLTGTVVLQQGIWSTLNNPSGLAGAEAFGAGVFYKNRWLLRELATRGFGLVLPAKDFAVLGIGYQQTGYTSFKRQQAGISVARRFGSSVSAGFRFEMLALHIDEDYGNANVFTMTAGVQIKLTAQLRWGMSVFNPSQPKINDVLKERLYATYKTGISFVPGEHAEWNIQVTKTGNTKELVTASINYHISKRIGFTAGVSGGAEPVFIGFSFISSRFEIATVTSYHELMGFSPQLTLIWNKK